VLLQQRAVMMLVHASCVTWGLMHLGRAASLECTEGNPPELWLLHLLLLLLRQLLCPPCACSASGEGLLTTDVVGYMMHTIGSINTL
jgi:hypothetical protein